MFFESFFVDKEFYDYENVTIVSGWGKLCFTDNVIGQRRRRFKSASSSSKTDTFNIWCNNSRMWQVTLDDNWSNEQVVSCC